MRILTTTMLFQLALGVVVAFAQEEAASVQEESENGARSEDACMGARESGMGANLAPFSWPGV